MEKSLLEKIQAVIVGPNLLSVATVTEENTPWVRYIMGIGSKDLSISFATNLSSRKVPQIRRNPEVHVTCGVGDFREIKPFVQYQARAEILTDQASKSEYWMPQLARFFKSEDNPDYAVVKLQPYRIEYMAVGATCPETLEI